MKLDLREKEGISILVLGGQLTGGGGDEQFREAIDTLLASGRNRILVDFTDVAFMDSAGMGELVSGHRTVQRFGGNLKILNPTKRVHNSLTMAKLLPIFEIFDDEDAAVKSFHS
ncbi:MAG TPA: STAS domain-containing protein [Vicinamibacteria bacterium]|nr:STAS domain-containing protein [Vicinamibacteria bacterium]